MIQQLYEEDTGIQRWLPVYRGGYRYTEVVTGIQRWLPVYRGGYKNLPLNKTWRE